MRALLVLIGLLPLLAQQPTAPVTTPAPTPTPAAESALTGSIDLGYRWAANVSGSVDTYRSIVNLGSGPKFLAADLTLTDPKKRLFDRLHIRASGWGGDPYSVAHVDGVKSGLYDFTADYRDIAYFNFLPSYADPLLTRGITLNEQSFDTRRRFGGFSLNLLPGNWFIPYPQIRSRFRGPAQARPCLCPTATNTPCRTSCAMRPTSSGAACVLSCVAFTPPSRKAEPPSRAIKACLTARTVPVMYSRPCWVQTLSLSSLDGCVWHHRPQHL